MKKPLTMAQYHEARARRRALRPLDCSLRSDAAGAVIVTSRERARDLRQPPVPIKGFGSFNNLRGWFADDNMVTTAAKNSGEAAYRMAGVGPADVGTAQIYDCFTYMVLTQLEDYGFCKKGEGGPFVASGALRMGGRLPTNTSGGQLVGGALRGHAPSRRRCAPDAPHLSGGAPSRRTLTSRWFPGTAAIRSATRP